MPKATSSYLHISPGAVRVLRLANSDKGVLVANLCTGPVITSNSGRCQASEALDWLTTYSYRSTHLILILLPRTLYRVHRFLYEYPIEAHLSKLGMPIENSRLVISILWISPHLPFLFLIFSRKPLDVVSCLAKRLAVFVSRTFSSRTQTAKIPHIACFLDFFLF